MGQLVEVLSAEGAIQVCPGYRGRPVLEFMPSATLRVVLVLAAAAFAAAGWKADRRAPLEAEVTLRIALNRRNPESLLEHLLSVSDPESPSHGKHFHREHIRQLFSPRASAVASVDTWLRQRHQQIRSVEWSQHWDYVTVSGTAGAIERLLNTTIHSWREEAEDDDGEEEAERGEEKEEEVTSALATAVHGEELQKQLPPEIAPFVAYLTGVAELPSASAVAAARRHRRGIRAVAAWHRQQDEEQKRQKEEDDGWEVVIDRVRRRNLSDPFLDREKTTQPVVVGFGGNGTAIFSLPLLCPGQERSQQQESPSQQESSSPPSSFASLSKSDRETYLRVTGQKADETGEGILKHVWFCINGSPRTLNSGQPHLVATASSSSAPPPAFTAADTATASSLLHLSGIRVTYKPRLPSDTSEPLAKAESKLIPSSAFTCHTHPSRRRRWRHIDSSSATAAPHCLLTVTGLTNYLPYSFGFDIVWTPVPSTAAAGAAEDTPLPGTVLATAALKGVAMAPGGSERSGVMTGQHRQQEELLVRLDYPLLILPDERKTPAFVKEYYGVPKDLVATHPWNRQAVASMYLSHDARGYYSPADLREFYKRVNIPVENEELVSLRGGGRNRENMPDGETQLDIQWITAMAPGVRSYVWRSRNDRSDPFEELFEELQKLEHPPLVFTISYDGHESDYHPRKLAHISQALQILGLQGITVLVASGDAGAFGSGGKCGKLRPYFPASSPWVTSVGATQLMAESVENRERPSEVACSIATGALITTGGGFSLHLEQPWYQREAVREYLEAEGERGLQQRLVGGADKLVTKTRGYPDLSIFGHNYLVMEGGQAMSVDGTSAGAPALGGILTLYNDRRLHAGLRPLGFINPLLYKLSRLLPNTSFHRVTRGDARCQTNGICCTTGYSCSESAHWNPVTGLGSPRFDVIGPYLAGEKSLHSIIYSSSSPTPSSSSPPSSPAEPEQGHHPQKAKESTARERARPKPLPPPPLLSPLAWAVTAAAVPVILAVVLCVKWWKTKRSRRPRGRRQGYEPVPSAVDEETGAAAAAPYQSGDLY